MFLSKAIPKSFITRSVSLKKCFGAIWHNEDDPEPISKWQFALDLVFNFSSFMSIGGKEKEQHEEHSFVEVMQHMHILSL